MLVAAFAAFHKYWDRTELADKSLKGTREALDALRAYISRSLADSVKPTVERIIANATSSDSALEELRGESFLDDVSIFVNRDIDEILSYRRLLNARTRWSAWSRKMSWGVLVFLIVQLLLTSFFAIVGIMLKVEVPLASVLATFSISGVLLAYCFICAGVMIYYHDQIAEYRDKVL